MQESNAKNAKQDRPLLVRKVPKMAENKGFSKKIYKQVFPF